MKTTCGEIAPGDYHVVVPVNVAGTPGPNLHTDAAVSRVATPHNMHCLRPSSSCT